MKLYNILQNRIFQLVLSLPFLPSSLYFLRRRGFRGRARILKNTKADDGNIFLLAMLLCQTLSPAQSLPAHLGHKPLLRTGILGVIKWFWLPSTKFRNRLWRRKYSSTWSILPPAVWCPSLWSQERKCKPPLKIGKSDKDDVVFYLWRRHRQQRRWGRIHRCPRVRGGTGRSGEVDKDDDQGSQRTRFFAIFVSEWFSLVIR